MRNAILLLLLPAVLPAQDAQPLTVDFSKHIRTWDGFGFNYVEAPQTRDYARAPQEYGGLSRLPEEKRRQILELVFGAGGLKPGVVKMFLDPWHQKTPGAAYDHETTTKWMRYFVREGLERTRARGGDLKILTTLYGPPAWMTKQKFLRGRDLDPAHKRDLAAYIAEWVKYLRETERLPVTAAALHNEGEDFSRWPTSGRDAGEPSHDYNLYWPPAQVVEGVKLLREALDARGLHDVQAAPGETTNWYRFIMWGYATALAADPEAIKALGLITSHGFTGTERWFGDHNPAGNEILRAAKPGLHSWTTSMTWGRMDTGFGDDIRRQIYDVGVNAVIPWAGVQTDQWTGGDPNPGTAIRVIADCGCFTVQPGYWIYKQWSRAGQPGMSVASVKSTDNRLKLAAFASNGTANANAFVLANATWNEIRASIRIRGGKSTSFQSFRTAPGEMYKDIGEVGLRNGSLEYAVPPKSTTTFFER